MERSKLGRSHGCPGRLWVRFLCQVYTSTIVGTMLWTEYRPVIKIGPKGALGSNEIRPIHSSPSLGQSITGMMFVVWVTQDPPDRTRVKVRLSKAIQHDIDDR